METLSTCCYCGVGCGLVIESEGDRITGVRGDPAHPANHGKLCSKGASLHLTARNEMRVLHPELRTARHEARRRVSWDEALDAAADKFADVIRTHGPDAVGFYISGQLLTEDYYVFNKLVKGLIGSNNLDTNSRLCMSSAVAGYKATLGADAPPGCYEDIDHAGSLFIAGSNMAYAHPILFRRIEAMAAEGMPAGYSFVPQPNEVASAVLSKCTWAVLALTCHVELFTQAHYRQSIDPDTGLSELWKDVFLFHWKEESQHAILDELEWRRENARLTPEQRDQAVSDLIDLVGAVDGILQVQAAADVDYFLRVCGRTLDGAQARQLSDTMLKAYRWQYIGSGVQDERFQKILGGMVTDAQMKRIGAALSQILA